MIYANEPEYKSRAFLSISRGGGAIFGSIYWDIVPILRLNYHCSRRPSKRAQGIFVQTNPQNRFLKWCAEKFEAEVVLKLFLIFRQI